MPHEWNNIVVVTKEELVPDWFPTWSALKLRIHRYKDKSFGIKRARFGGYGHELLIIFDSLDKHIQDALGDPRKADHIFERYYKLDNEAVTFYTGHKFNDGTYLTFEQQEKYIINASVLKAAVKLRADRQSENSTMGLKVANIMKKLCEDATSFNKTLRVKHQVNHTLPETEKHFKRVLKAFETNSYLSLIPATHKNSNSRKVTDETLSLLNNMFATDRTKPTATKVHERYNKFLAGYIEVINCITGESYQPGDFRKLSNATVKKYMAAWVNQIGTMAKRTGNRQQFMQQFKTPHSLDKPTFAGSIISIDDRQPPFKTSAGKRVWFYNAYDIGACAFTCWVYGASKEGIILDFYRQLVRNYASWGFHLPNELEAEMSLNSSYVNTFLREGAMFQQVRIEANNARGKYIERVYGSLRYEYEKELPGFIPRPFARSESNQSGADEPEIMPYDTIIQNCLRALEEWNNRPHPIHKHLSRWQVFCQMQHPELKPTNYIAILPHIGYKTKTSCRVGIIKLQGGEFLLGQEGKVSLGAALISLMKRVEGEIVDVFWLDDNNGDILKALVFIGDQYICEAVAKPTYNRARIEQGPADEAARTIMSAYVASIEAFGKRQKHAIERITIIDNTPQPEKTFIISEINRYVPATNGGMLPPLPDQEFPEFSTDDIENDNVLAKSTFRTTADRFLTNDNQVQPNGTIKHRF